VLSLVALVPESPLLVPELAPGVSVEAGALRGACIEVAARLAAAAPRWIAVGVDPGGRRTVGPDARGTFAGFGSDVVVALGPRADGPPDPRLPLPLLIAGWIAGAAPAAPLDMAVRIRGELVAPDAPEPECAALGAAIAAECAADPEPVGLLVLGDGGQDGPRADHTPTAAALDAADPRALAALDLAPHATGRVPWQVLAGAAASRRWHGELLHSSARFGVAHHVAIWTPAA
jgi:hypothetical protein